MLIDRVVSLTGHSSLYDYRPQLFVPDICPENSHSDNDLYCVEWGVKLYSLTHSGERVRTTFTLETSCWDGVPVVKVLITHYGWQCEPFSCQKCTRLEEFAYTTSKFVWGWSHRTTKKRCRCLDTDTNFRLAQRRSNFTQRSQVFAHSPRTSTFTTFS